MRGNFPGWSALSALALVIATISVPAFSAPVASFAASALTIVTKGGPRHFRIELARTPEEQEQGLMYRHFLPEDAGMLFEFDHAARVAFWMKNTFIPLDMLFIAANGRISDIHERAVPMSLEPISARGPVVAVLELNGGRVRKLGIRRGDRVLHAFFHAAP